MKWFLVIGLVLLFAVPVIAQEKLKSDMPAFNSPELLFSILYQPKDDSKLKDEMRKGNAIILPPETTYVLVEETERISKIIIKGRGGLWYVSTILLKEE